MHLQEERKIKETIEEDRKGREREEKGGRKDGRKGGKKEGKKEKREQERERERRSGVSKDRAQRIKGTGKEGGEKQRF